MEAWAWVTGYGIRVGTAGEPQYTEQVGLSALVSQGAARGVEPENP
jgi:hypothetical protein